MPKRPPIHKPHGSRTDEERRKQNDIERGSASHRGYDRDWQALRKLKLQSNPLCECDDCQAGEKRITQADVVDHIIPIRQRPELRLTWSNLRSMAKACHDRHTAKEQGFARSNRS